MIPDPQYMTAMHINPLKNALTQMMCPAGLQLLKAVPKTKAAVMVWQSPVPRRQIINRTIKSN